VNKRTGKALVLLLTVSLLSALLFELFPSVHASVEPPANWGLTLSSDKSIVAPDDVVTFSVGFNVFTELLSGVSNARVIVYLPHGLNYNNGTLIVDGRPSALVTQPATAAGTSVVVVVSSETPGRVELNVNAVVTPGWAGQSLDVSASLYLQPSGGGMPITANDEAVLTLQSVLTPGPLPVVPEVYWVRFDLDGGRRVGGGVLKQAVYAGGSAVEPYVYKDGYTFLGWNRSFSNVLRDITVTALWTDDDDGDTYPPGAGYVDGYFMRGNDVFTNLSHIPMVFIAESRPSRLVSVEIDGRRLSSRSDYVATSGSSSQETAIHLRASYLNDLRTGTHTLRVNFRDESYASGQFRVQAYRNPFNDIHISDWFVDGVEAMNASGLLQGTDATHFEPHVRMSRGMVVTLIYRYTGQPVVSGFRNPFPDVGRDSYYSNAVVWAAANGIVTGRDTGRFDPYDDMTREEFATVLYRYQEAIGSDVFNRYLAREYSDYDKIGYFARAAVSDLTMVGIYRDLPFRGDLFEPQAPVDRAEVATVMWRWIESIGW